MERVVAYPFLYLLFTFFAWSLENSDFVPQITC